MISRSERRRIQKSRKTPFRHRVKSHVRGGVQVISYERGRGRQPRQPKKRRRTGVRSSGPRPGRRTGGLTPLKTKFTQFHVSIKFPRGGGESLPVDAKNFATALTRGLTKRERADPPKSVLVRRVQ